MNYEKPPAEPFDMDSSALHRTLGNEDDLAEVAIVINGQVVVRARGRITEVHGVSGGFSEALEFEAAMPSGSLVRVMARRVRLMRVERDEETGAETEKG